MGFTLAVRDIRIAGRGFSVVEGVHLLAELAHLLGALYFNFWALVDRMILRVEALSHAQGQIVVFDGVEGGHGLGLGRIIERKLVGGVVRGHEAVGSLLELQAFLPEDRK
uniref:Uncharacterized protein n=1 Tax=Strombidium inclinatum TaxID=197538 RepID=A0A7S3N1Q7_9SPIT